MDISRKLGAEFHRHVLARAGRLRQRGARRGYPHVGIGYAGVALAFGLTVVTGAYAFGHISGAHFNPAVTLGLWTAGRFPARDVIPYWIAQVAGAIAAAAVLDAIASGLPAST
jgi:aquaporin Z